MPENKENNTHKNRKRKRKERGGCNQFFGHNSKAITTGGKGRRKKNVR
jgi:hypothetical protein